MQKNFVDLIQKVNTNIKQKFRVLEGTKLKIIKKNDL